MRTLLNVIGAAVGLSLVAVAGFLLLFDINDWTDWIESQASATLGREVQIEGSIAVDWGWKPTVTVEQLVIANADWADAPHFAKIEQETLSLDLNARFEVGLTGEPLRFDVDLASDKLDFDDLAGLVGAPTEKQAEPQQQESGSLIPIMDINLERLVHSRRCLLRSPCSNGAGGERIPLPGPIMTVS